MLWCVLCCSVPLCASVSPGVPRCTVCYVVCYAASTKNGSHGYTGHNHALPWGPSPGNLEALRCRHTPLGGAGSKHPGRANENCAHFSSHLISRVASVGSMGLGVAPPCAAVMCVALCRAMRLSITLPCNALCCCVGCVSRCAVCRAVSRCVPLSVPCACVFCRSVLPSSFVRCLALLRCKLPGVAPLCLVLLIPSTRTGGRYK